MSEINIYFEDKDYIFDDINFCWYISSPLNDYCLQISFMGAINEDGEENLYSSCGCEISLHEVEHHKQHIMDTVKERIENDCSIELETYDETICICSPDVRSSIYYTDESSFDSSLGYAKEFLKHLCAVLDSAPDNIDEIIDSNFEEVA